MSVHVYVNPMFFKEVEMELTLRVTTPCVSGRCSQSAKCNMGCIWPMRAPVAVVA